jgi:hypothetical protein
VLPHKLVGLIEAGSDPPLAEPKALAAMRKACEQ